MMLSPYLCPPARQLQNTDDFRFAADDLVLLASWVTYCFVQMHVETNTTYQKLVTGGNSICTTASGSLKIIWWQHLAQAELLHLQEIADRRNT
eukprot:scaffold532_cov174-Skeletonema_marinoi.AAC.5